MPRLDQKKHDLDVLEHVLSGVQTTAEDDRIVVSDPLARVQLDDSTRSEIRVRLEARTVRLKPDTT